ATRIAGRSWERIDRNRSGNDPNNWGPTASGHTAGRVNSLKPVDQSVGLSVHTEPNPFNPYDGELAWIRFTLPVEVARLTVDIYDLHSRRIRRLTANAPAGTDQPLISWDGRDDRDRMMSIGRYIIVVEAIDLRGGETYIARCTVVSAGRLR
ncbi:MAG: FlgD immunoglobulin-like domain containing protein, partial [Candidatus Electryoneaceae bacterium]|nr:FlgD immunoglobulin-like domain containing protein [Candidatus Electryoneaceae bacterium]